MAAEGHTNAAIGKRLFISPPTVEIHRANMMAKLDLRNHTDLNLVRVEARNLAGGVNPPDHSEIPLCRVEWIF